MMVSTLLLSPPALARACALSQGVNLLATLPASLADCAGLSGQHGHGSSSSSSSGPREGVMLLDGNPMHTPPREIVARGTPAVLAYLKGMKGGATPVFKTKLMFVGLGGVGKTALANALQGKQ